jgi:hypothetical protein
MNRWGQGIRWFHNPEKYAQDMKVFHALIGSHDEPRAKRVSVEARNIDEAKSSLEASYGVGRVLSLWVDAEWQMPRDK